MADPIAPVEAPAPLVDAPAGEVPILRAVATADDAMQARATQAEAAIRAAIPTDRIIELALASHADPSALEEVGEILAGVVEDTILPAIEEASAEAEVLGQMVGDAVEGIG